MKPRNLFEFVGLGWLFFLVLPVNLLSAQQGFRSLDVASTETDPVAQLVQAGVEFERQQRWGEALSHYEEAVRRYPNQPELQRRMGVARTYFDLSRRYIDDSFLDTLNQVSEQQALDLFGEVVLKIQSHYVQEPDWNQTLKNGTSCLRVALTDETFNRVNQVRGGETQAEQMVNYVDQVFSQRDVHDRRQAQELVRWAARVISRRLSVPVNAVIFEYICGAASHLDSYSTFLTADQLDEVYSQIEGNFVGLGVELRAVDRSLLIANVIANGPASMAGIQAGDRIIGVDGVLTRDVTTDHAADMLKGERGTFVDVELLAPSGDVRTIRVRRDRVEVPSVEDVKMVDMQAGVGYFRISSFQKTTSRDVDAALWKLHRDGMRSLVIDVRGNPGGLLNESVEVADRFIVEGTIVATHGRNTRENFDYKAHRVGTWRVPLVVLIDGDSASASEIFAGAIRDHRRGTVVGDRSYGKGSVQGIFPLRAVKGGVRLTTAKFYSPSGQAISQGGVEPDIQVHSVAKPVVQSDRLLEQDGDDLVLVRGTQIARELITTRQRPTQQRNARVSTNVTGVDRRD